MTQVMQESSIHKTRQGVNSNNERNKPKIEQNDGGDDEAEIVHIMRPDYYSYTTS
jgi:hypothetical protein